MNAVPPQSRKRWLWLAIALAVVLLGVFWVFIKKPGNADAPTPAAEAAPRPSLTVTVAKPTRGDLPIRLQANGNITAWQEASVGAEVNGLRLASVNVNVGDVVRKGQVLAVFANETTKADSLQSQASLAQAEASFENAKADADRARSIQDTGALSKSQVAQYLTQETGGARAVRGRQGRLRRDRGAPGQHARARARRRRDLRAHRHRRARWWAPGRSCSAWCARAGWSGAARSRPTRSGRIRVGQKVQVTGATGLEISGQVRAIAPGADPQTRNILVFVDLPRHAELKAGTFARGQLRPRDRARR
jgi:HlyD family secretion protein